MKVKEVITVCVCIMVICLLLGCVALLPNAIDQWFQIGEYVK